MKPHWGIFCLLGAFVFLSVPNFLQAASLYIDPPISTLYRGDAVNYAIRLDTDESIGECVNAVDAIVSYPANIDPVDVSIGNSIFSMWVEQPTINEAERTITFAGGIPNGYCGRVAGDPMLTNVLAEFVFRSPGFIVGQEALDDNQAELSFADETTAYLNDGFGTKANLTTYPARITLAEGRGDVLVNSWKDKVDADNIPPEQFSIFLEQQDVSNKYFIVFNTTDKQTGIDVYQVMEQPLSQFGSFEWGRADAPWVETRSPFILKDQSLNSVIRVKAIDKAGNEYIATLIPEESLRSYSPNQMMTIVLVMFSVVLLAVVIIILSFFIRKRKRKGADLEPELEEEELEDFDDEHEEMLEDELPEVENK